ncbi:hypothetical protein ABZX93_14465 [Streptomyces sp. NPDC006632]|uniref:hypothetical protein n=1 Tax=unclassified Streptomyces TaxID=2593676 RepID=UPI002E1C762A
MSLVRRAAVAVVLSVAVTVPAAAAAQAAPLTAPRVAAHDNHGTYDNHDYGNRHRQHYGLLSGLLYVLL